MKEADIIHLTDKGLQAWDGEVHEYFPLIEWTGLLDKNGKEIYEGDLLQYVSTSTRGQIRGPVVFRSGKFTDSPTPDLKYKNNNYLGTPSYSKGFEVIGNIYENPELIKQNE